MSSPEAFGGWVWNHARPAPTLTWDHETGQVVRVQTKSFWIDTPTDLHLIELGFEKMAASAEILRPTTLQAEVTEPQTWPRLELGPGSSVQFVRTPGGQTFRSLDTEGYYWEGPGWDSVDWRTLRGWGPLTDVTEEVRAKLSAR